MAKKDEELKCSPKNTFDGWKLWQAVKGTLKQVVCVGVPMLVAFVATKSPGYAVLAGLVGKFLIGTVEYFISEY